MEDGWIPYHDIDGESVCRVYGDVTMQRPDSRVIGQPFKNNKGRSGVGSRLQNVRVAALRVGRVDDNAVPDAGALGQDPEAVAVEMHGVGHEESVPNDDADGSALAEVVDVPFWMVGVACVSEIGEEEEWVAAWVQ